MVAQLTVHNAEIKTAAVEIKALTVSGRQVTQSVFRQLKESALVTENGHLAGLPWGSINYHPDKCGDDTSHLHVVWQKDQELRRARVDAPGFGRWFCESGDAFITSSVADWIRGGSQFWGGKCPLAEQRHYKDRFTSNFITLHGEHSDVVVAMDPAEAAAVAANATSELREAEQRVAEETVGDPRWRAESLASSRKVFDDAMASLDMICAGYNATTAGLFDQYKADLDAEASRRARHQARWAELLDLPQLFIAV
jgi:hypothetical protein